MLGRIAFPVRLGVIVLCCSFAGSGIAQDIEPRRWTPLPVGMNVFGVGIIYTEGDIAFDPVLELEDVTVEQKMAVVSYLRAFDLSLPRSYPASSHRQLPAHSVLILHPVNSVAMFPKATH